MLRSQIVIIASSNNADCNTVSDIAHAVELFDATDIELSDNGVIHASIPTKRIAWVNCIEGVSYVRNEMTYATNEVG